MNVSGKVPHTVDRLKELLKKLGLLYLDNAKLTVTEKLTELVSAGVMLIVTLVGGAFLILIGVLALLKKKIVVNPIARFISRLVYEQRDGNE